MLANYLRDRLAEEPDTAVAAAHARIVDCHTGYHECPDEIQRARQVFDYECPTLRALVTIYAHRADVDQTWLA